MEKKLGKMFSGFKKGLFLFTALMLITLPSSVFAGNAKIKTMTRNLYLGADIFKVVDAAQTDPSQIPYAVADVYQTMLYTNFWERAEALADEIAFFEPDVVGLQEVSTYYIQTPGDYMIGNPVQANEVVIDFYSVLDAALKARGMYYDSFTVTNADIEMPMADPNAGPPYYLSDVRLFDHDVILVHEDHVASNEFKGNYQYQLELDLGGTSVAFTRGYISVDVNIKGDDFRFVNTHLEVRSAPGSVFRVFQAAQMQELLVTVDALAGYFGTKPVIMVGDFNSSSEDVPGESYVPDGQGGYVLMPYVPPYMMAIGAGYKDAWLEQKKYDDGFTSGFDEYVSDPTAELTSRIDLIFVDPGDLELHKVKAKVVGNKVKDMTPSGFWPSDHAGVVAKVKFHDQATNCSYLGNDPKPSLLDQDVFKFEGIEGEEVTITLEEAAGDNTGERATLILKDRIRRVRLFEIDRSALPNKITAQLPATGEYRIIISEQSRFIRGERFRGNYCLTLGSSADAWQTLEATAWVE